MQYIAYKIVSDSSICGKYPVICVLTLRLDIYIFVLVCSNRPLKPVCQLTYTGVTWLITMGKGGGIMDHGYRVSGTQMTLFCVP